MRRAASAAAAAAAGLQVPQIPSWQEPPPKERPGERDLAAGSSTGTVLDPKERVQSSLTLAGRAVLSAAECSGGSGMLPAPLFT